MASQFTSRKNGHTLSSLWVPEHGTAEQGEVLSPWPTPCPKDWTDQVIAVRYLRELLALNHPTGACWAIEGAAP